MSGQITVRVIDLQDMAVVSAAGKTLRSPKHAVATARDYRAVFPSDNFIIRIHYRNLSAAEYAELRQLTDLEGFLLVDGWT